MFPNPIFANMFKNKININLINSNNFTGNPVIMPHSNPMINNPILNNPILNNPMLNNPIISNNIINPYRTQFQNNLQHNKQKKKEEKPVKPNSMLNYIYGGQVRIYLILAFKT